jgi:ABC-type nitrate/sulfonate/bicarbonate transport system substrate-binding protein
MRAAAWLLLLSLALAAHAEDALRVMGFGGASNWPLFVAQDEGFFEREGLRVELARARDSASQMAQLAEGRIDIAMTAMDNVVAWSRGDVFAFMGVNHGARFRLFGRRDVGSMAALRGADIGVDALGTGYAFVLQAMLRDAGLAPGDYRLVSVGGSRERWKALQEGRVAATLLNAPYDATAQSRGYRLLGRSGNVGRYQGSVGAARREWARAHEAVLVRYIRAYVAALRWLCAPEHRDAAIAVLVKRQPGIDRAEAGRTYEDLLDPAGGSLARDAALDIDGVAKVLALRREFTAQAKLAPDPSEYYDLRYWREALSSPAARR